VILKGRSGSPRLVLVRRVWGLRGEVMWLCAGGDDGVPGDALGDHDVQPAQDGGSACGACLLASEPVVVAGGEVGELRGQDGVVG
jgi:hypothetical protein